MMPSRLVTTTGKVSKGKSLEKSVRIWDGFHILQLTEKSQKSLLKEVL